MLDEVAGLKAALALEREERIAEDDEIVQVGAWARQPAPGCTGGGGYWPALCGSGFRYNVGLHDCLQRDMCVPGLLCKCRFARGSPPNVSTNRPSTTTRRRCRRASSWSAHKQPSHVLQAAGR